MPYTLHSPWQCLALRLSLRHDGVKLCWQEPLVVHRHRQQLTPEH